jgi:hypothetical protein
LWFWVQPSNQRLKLDWQAVRTAILHVLHSHNHPTPASSELPRMKLFFG